MASNQPPLADRPDVHKSCRSLETLLNVLNDYCEAAGAVVTIQKKLSKALRETAGMKVTGDIPANTMNASATIFEALADIDAKFARMADREYDAISGEVKKWFKKLAKEEKTHDERMANANAKIKQAGQAYEKKSKKKSVDMTDEHARYINLISTLGPEISQEKHTHALSVTQRHSTTTYSVASALSRVADAEWLRACEGVRRCASTVGRLGEWRSLCEGGWVGEVPGDLEDVPGQEGQGRGEPGQGREERWREEEEERQRRGVNLAPPGGGGGMLSPPDQGQPQSGRSSRESSAEPHTPTRPGPPPVYTSSTDITVPPGLAPPSPVIPTPTPSQPSPSAESPPAQQQTRQQQFSSTSAGSNSTSTTSPSASTAPSAFGGGLSASHPPSAFADPTAAAGKHPWVDPNTGSVRSLSAFPSPPTHFPIPPLPRGLAAAPNSNANTALGANTPVMGMGRMSESPLPTPDEDDEGDENPGANRDAVPPRENVAAAPSPRGSPEQTFQDRPPRAAEQASPSRVRAQTQGQGAGDREKGDYFDEGREFGIGRAGGAGSGNAREGREVRESSGSIVAAMRSRYVNNSGSSSPPPKDIPRLPLSVPDLATRYQPGDPPSPSFPRTKSPPIASRRLSLPPPLENPNAANINSNPSPTAFPTRGSPEHAYRGPISPSLRPSASTSAEQRRQQRIDELAELELEEKERELRERERDIEMRARELDRERARLVGMRRDSGAREEEEFPLRPRERRTSLRQQQLQQQQRPLSAHAPDARASLAAERARPQYSYSATHLGPPSPSSSSPAGRYAQQQPRELHTQYEYQDQDEDPSQHAPYCGCEICSIAKYRTPSSTSVSTSTSPISQPQAASNTLRPPAPEKPKGGWMRRLSMPVVVGNAFNLDSKPKRERKDSSSSGRGIAGGKGVGFTMDAKKNVSATALRVQEDGRMGPVGGGGLGGRRSYDTSQGIGNRSMTNLGVAGRR